MQKTKLEALEWYSRGPAEEVENVIFIRISPRKRVPQIFPASVCATHLRECPHRSVTHCNVTFANSGRIKSKSFRSLRQRAAGVC